MHTINLKASFPTLDEARRRLLAEMQAAGQRNTRVLKVIHGWGSGGEGGALAVGIRKSLRLRVKEGRAVLVVPGERSPRIRSKVASCSSATRRSGVILISTAPIPASPLLSWDKPDAEPAPVLADRGFQDTVFCWMPHFERLQRRAYELRVLLHGVADLHDLERPAYAGREPAHVRNLTRGE